MKKAAEAPLLVAAQALTQALADFAELAESVARLPLTSEKHLRKAGHVLTEIAEAEQCLQPHVQALSDALSAARVEQQAQAEAMAVHAARIESRTKVFETLMQGLAALGTQGAQVREFAQKDVDAGNQAAIAELSARIAALAGDAQRIYETALKDEFHDVAAHAHTLREQLLSAQRKIDSARPS